MRIEGLVKTWNDERGFGFIEPIGGGPEIFVHVKAFRSRTIRPQVGQHVSFEVALDRERRKRAKNVEFTRAARVATRHGSKWASDWGSVTIAAIPAFAVLYAIVAFLWRVPNWVGAVYVGLSIVCFAFYWADKAAANSGSRRTPEEKLLVAGLLGGWPGAILAQQLLRHKSIKASFRSAFWTSVVANVCAFVVLSSPLVDAWSRVARAIS